MVGGVLHLQPELQVPPLRAARWLCAGEERALDAVVIDEMVGIDRTLVPFRSYSWHLLASPADSPTAAEEIRGLLLDPYL